MLSVMQLRKHDFTEVSIVANQEVTDDKVTETAISCRHQFRTSPIDEKLNNWIARLRLELVAPEDDRLPLYTGAVEVFGEFEMHSDLPEDQRSKYACINGGAMLYGAAREMFTLLTSRSMHGIIELPTIDPRVFQANGTETEQK